jgi:predicted nucleotidyltransferase
MTDFRSLLATLAAQRVDFIVVGGAAATAHGATRLTQDIDIVYARTADNLRRLVAALAPHRPYLRGAPPGLPFIWDERTLSNGLNFTLTTDLGDIDLLGEITGGGGFEQLLPDSISLSIFGHDCRCLGLKKLISVKRAAGRPKDFEAIAELEMILAATEQDD